MPKPHKPTLKSCFFIITFLLILDYSLADRCNRKVQPNCQNCDSSGTVCQKCEEGFVLQSGECISCPDGCSTCTIVGDQANPLCTKCMEGYTEDLLNCQKCSKNCRSCAMLPEDCTACYDLNKLDESTKECVFQVGIVGIIVSSGVAIIVLIIVAIICIKNSKKHNEESKKDKVLEDALLKMQAAEEYSNNPTTSLKYKNFKSISEVGKGQGPGDQSMQSDKSEVEELIRVTTPISAQFHSREHSMKNSHKEKTPGDRQSH